MSEPDSLKKPEIFVSYSSKDESVVESVLVRGLHKLGCGVFYAPEAVRITEEWHRKIVAALERCDWLLVALTKHAVDSPWVRGEVQRYLDRRPDRIVQVLLRDCEPSDLDLRLLRRHHADFRDLGRIDEQWKKLAEIFAIPVPATRGPAKFEGRYVDLDDDRRFLEFQCDGVVFIKDGTMVREPGQYSFQGKRLVVRKADGGVYDRYEVEEEGSRLVSSSAEQTIFERCDPSANA